MGSHRTGVDVLTWKLIPLYWSFEEKPFLHLAIGASKDRPHVYLRCATRSCAQHVLDLFNGILPVSLLSPCGSAEFHQGDSLCFLQEALPGVDVNAQGILQELQCLKQSIHIEKVGGAHLCYPVAKGGSDKC